MEWDLIQCQMVLKNIYDKQWYNKQLTQFEFNELKRIANLNRNSFKNIKDWGQLIDYAQTLYEVEEALDFMHCENIRT